MTVNQLETNARFVGFLLVRSADARTDKKGGSYLDLTLADKTGDINCKYWDWNQLMDVPKQGSVIKVQGWCKSTTAASSSALSGCAPPCRRTRWTWRSWSRVRPKSLK